MSFHFLRLGVCGAVLFLGAASPVFAQPSAAAAEIRFQELERELRRLTGQIEEQNYEIRRLKDELADVRAQVEAQASAPVVQAPPRLAQPLNPPVGVGAGEIELDDEVQKPDVGLGSQTQTLGQLNQPKNGGAAQAYDYAYSFIKARDFARAEAEFAGFLQEHSESDLAGNAQYWFAETFYVRGDYDRAAREFASGYQRYPKGGKAASNLLKLGMSLKGMGKTGDACIAFKQLKGEYKGASVPVLKRAASEMGKIDCR